MIKILKKVNLQNLFREGNVNQFGIVLAQEEKALVQVVFAVPLGRTDQHWFTVLFLEAWISCLCLHI